MITDVSGEETVQTPTISIYIHIIGSRLNYFHTSKVGCFVYFRLGVSKTGP